ncbi:MAG: ABC transporter permease [Candidatus Firestonebacteria bacterium]|nr:ABC transporter permease [Candidatus Firestonebacteria bacterium]
MINRTIAGFFRKEISQTLRDPRMRALVFIAPILQLLLFGYAISTEIRNIKLAVQYTPGDVLARRWEERAMHSRWFVSARTSGNDPFAWVHSGQADAVLVMPAGGLTRGVGRGGAKVQLLIDATNVVKAQAVERYVQMLLKEVLSEAFPSAQAPPVFAFDIRMLYNPAMVTSYFLVPGVMMMLLCLVTILLTSMSIVRERESGTFETLISAPLKNWEILVGKTLPFMVLGLVIVHLILVAAILIFGLPFRGPYWKFLLAGFMFVLTTVSIGTLISTIAKRQQQAMMATFLFLFPAIMLSGMMFPVENMPKALIGVAYLNPLKYMLTLLRNILLKGGDDWVFWTNLSALFIIAVVAVGVSFNRFRQSLN